jgi:protein-S-isoprenylcysteine O-methyltransferase Ste14
MRRRSLILGAVFAGAFAASYLLAASGQLPPEWGDPGAPLWSGLLGAVLLTIGIGLNWWFWRMLMTAARPRSWPQARRSRDASDAHYYAAVGAASMSSYSSPADCSGGASSYGGDCGSGV